MILVIGLVVTAGVFVGVCFCAGGEERPWEDEWPALSDEEFVARCKPGTNPETALKVRAIISKHLGVPYEHVSPEQRFVEDLRT
ncbi:MAG: hypothetical protein AAF907_13155 [Planctomycetota bacterium]